MPGKTLTLTKMPLNPDLLRFYDEFSEFNDCCAFMCDALAHVSLKESYLDNNSAMGASRFCHWMKRRMQELKNELKEIHEKANRHVQVDAGTVSKKVKRQRKRRT